MLRRRTRSDLHRSAIRLSLFDAILLAPVIALPLLIVVGLALFSMVSLLIVTGIALSAIADDEILDRIAGKVEDIHEIAAGLFAVRIALSRATVGEDAGQLINM